MKNQSFCITYCFFVQCSTWHTSFGLLKMQQEMILWTNMSMWSWLVSYICNCICWWRGLHFWYVIHHCWFYHISNLQTSWIIGTDIFWHGISSTCFDDIHFQCVASTWMLVFSLHFVQCILPTSRSSQVINQRVLPCI